MYENVILTLSGVSVRVPEESYFPVLADHRKETAGYLSGGEQQMLAMGCALMSSPRYLLLDEPSLGLAPRLVNQIRDLVVQIRDGGTTSSGTWPTPSPPTS